MRFIIVGIYNLTSKSFPFFEPLIYESMQISKPEDCNISEGKYACWEHDGVNNL